MIIAGIIVGIVLKIRKTRKMSNLEEFEPLTDESKSKDAPLGNQ